MTDSCPGCTGQEKTSYDEEEGKKYYLLFKVKNLPENLRDNWDWLFKLASVAHYLKGDRDLAGYLEFCESDRELARCFHNQFLEAARGTGDASLVERVENSLQEYINFFFRDVFA